MNCTNCGHPCHCGYPCMQTYKDGDNCDIEIECCKTCSHNDTLTSEWENAYG